MRKKNIAKREIERAIAQERFEKRLSRKGVKYDPNKLRVTPQAPISGVPLVAPNEMSFYEVIEKEDNYIGSIKFSEKVKRNFGHNRCKFDFSSCTRITAAGMLVLFATMEQCRNDRSIKSALLWSKTPAVNRFLNTHKIHKFVKGIKFSPDLDSSKEVHVISGLQNEYFDQIIDFIKSRIFSDDMPAESEATFARAVSESMSNVTRHAYPGTTDSGKKWWLIIQVMNNRQIYLAIYDEGVGIPETVVDRPWFRARFLSSYPKKYQNIIRQADDPSPSHGNFRKFVPKLVSDAELISLSMQGNISSQTSSKHGQGSKSIRELVNNTPNGKLWIFSNNGLCLYSTKEEVPKLYDLPVKFPGTLIQWNISINDKNN